MQTVMERYDFANVENDGIKFFKEIHQQCKVYDAEHITLDSLMKIGTKDMLAKYLLHAVKLMDRQHNFAINQRVYIDSYKDDIIRLQGDVILAQEKGQEATARVIRAIEATEQVSEIVEETVKSSIKSYSEAVGVGNKVNSTGISQAVLKSVAKQVVVEEELSKNLMVFGLPEHEDEDVCASVMKVMEEISEKPKLQATRLGKKTASDIRPVKVTLTSAAAVQQILVKSKNLRRTENYKDVFLTPDRSREQRLEHRELVAQLKKKVEDEPQRYHYIRGGQLFSSDKSKTSHD